ncbi:hypothetical protein DPMN_191436 [Dreissena polymorpha]|uniref:Uncharacterized protein n=1 Tax=Dreissena polymorpha TaxID=45954 RepID=A0A9D3Y1B8_DREPO|nr:hypothetical protein DPMN_191436 [Dreissena polymorpha]
MERVTCSSTCPRSVFSTLLTLNHPVKCDLKECHITSCVEGSITRTTAIITTDPGNEFNIQTLVNDSPGLWEALQGLNIIILSPGNEDEHYDVIHKEMFSQFLSSLTHLKTLSIEMIPSFQSININDLSLILSSPSIQIIHIMIVV